MAQPDRGKLNELLSLRLCSHALIPTLKYIFAADFTCIWIQIPETLKNELINLNKLIYLIKSSKISLLVQAGNKRTRKTTH